jgi:hypothetical protein
MKLKKDYRIAQSALSRIKFEDQPWAAIEPSWNHYAQCPKSQLGTLLRRFTPGQRAFVALKWPCGGSQQRGHSPVSLQQLRGSVLRSACRYGLGGCARLWPSRELIPIASQPAAMGKTVPPTPAMTNPHGRRTAATISSCCTRDSGSYSVKAGKLGERAGCGETGRLS